VTRFAAAAGWYSVTSHQLRHLDACHLTFTMRYTVSPLSFVHTSSAARSSERGIEEMSALTGMAKMMVLTAYLSEESRRDLHRDRQDAAARASSTATTMRWGCEESPEKTIS